MSFLARLGRILPWKAALSAFALGFGLPLLFAALLPPSEPGYPYIAIAVSFVLNLAALAWTLACLPNDQAIESRSRFPHFKAWAILSVPMFCAFAGLWAAPVHHESARVFAAMALLVSAQSGALFAVHAALTVFFGARNRAPKTLCTLLTCVLVSALFWSREPIERLTKTGGDGSQHSAQLSDSVMKLSPPMTLAAAWYQEADGVRAQQSSASRRFDLVHGPLTYAVWIGSYQAVACPDILPSAGTGDFYTRREFTPGLVLILLLWSLPILVLCDVLLLQRRAVLPDSSK